MTEYIRKDAALDAVHKAAYDLFDDYPEDRDVPITGKDRLLLTFNKKACEAIRALQGVTLPGT